MAGKYKTHQYSQLLDFFIHGEKAQYSSAEIIRSVCREGGPGKSTVYRQLRNMTAEGTLRKFHEGESSGNKVFYQYAGRREDCDAHFHLKCVNCGALVHMECERVGGLKAHVQQTHSFIIDVAQTVFYGVCGKCSGVV